VSRAVDHATGRASQKQQAHERGKPVECPSLASRPLCAGFIAIWNNIALSEVTHNPLLCAKSDIAVLFDSAHNMSGVDRMSDLARTPQQIGNLIRRARKKNDLSQTELASRAGVRQETISLIETGNPAAKLQTILAVLAALNLELRVTPRSKSTAADIEHIF
jgi:HTH-type transcriptional regulator / antitoxin HipB